MTTVRKTAVTYGRHVSPDGVVDVTPQRVARWVRQFDAMRKQGIVVPVPWGHQMAAEPADDDDGRAYLASRYNAGYLKQLIATPTGLDVVADLPALDVDAGGNVIDPKERTAIREVSAGIGDWQDGKGRVWRDCIIHLALTPLPVWAGQTGFSRLGTRARNLTRLGGVAGRFFRLGGTPVADEKDEPIEDIEEISEEMMEPDGEEIFEEGITAPNPKDEMVMSIKGKLAEMGITLPETTDAANFLEHLDVALSVLQGKIGVTGGAAEVVEEPMEPMEPPVEEPAPSSPMMMGTLSPRERTLLATENRRARTLRLKRIDRLVARGIPGTLAADLRHRAERTNLSLLASGAFSRPAIDRELDTLEAALPKGKSPLTRLSTAREVASPMKPAGRTKKNPHGTVDAEVARDLRAGANFPPATK